MRYLKKYESTNYWNYRNEIESNINDLFRDSVIDSHIPLKVECLRNVRIKISDNSKNYWRGERTSLTRFIFNIDEIRDDLERVIEYLESEGFRFNYYSIIGRHINTKQRGFPHIKWNTCSIEERGNEKDKFNILLNKFSDKILDTKLDEMIIGFEKINLEF